jgi:hypothetical protein
MWKGLSLLAATDIVGTVKRNLNALVYFAIAAVLVLIGIIYALQALHYWLAFRIGVVGSSLVLAAVLLMVGGILMLVGQSVRERRQPPTSKLTAGAMMAAPFAARMVGRRVSVATIAVAGVVAIGALIGRQLGRE